MKIRTFHNRLERHEFTFDRADLLKLLKAEVQKFSSHSINAAATVDWEMLIDEDGEGVFKGITLEQRYEYLSTAIEEPDSAPAVPNRGNNPT